jgi:hypothetical protein
LEQPPVDLRETLEQEADAAVVAGHGADLGHEFLADVAGAGLLVDLDGEMVAALGGVFMERALEEVQGGVDLAPELFLAEPEGGARIIHTYAYKYAYFKGSKPARQERKV